ncbi:MAG: hypothetical protein UX22_C0025G0007 [Candidatus Jorgensenbacteria bacterium GW2011_GWA2_45_9]|uniref:Uncharacterized protein n=1 Tax=Candidatus Jorgensenbacteria bacterium GW2011_GWA2_45_9 TaxID=1618663 RepID=A0A0G1R0I0_9BACT|nr:MAG: hypothetical protein UX22_C0025G0007 [Candidatus Jorgensenbacteria bacterium GW2011_GWA2_45_9]
MRDVVFRVFVIVFAQNFRFNQIKCLFDVYTELVGEAAHSKEQISDAVHKHVLFFLNQFDSFSDL